jgi:hypothetical protein
VIAIDELKVPKELRPVVEEIVGITDSVCLSVLDEEYANLARRAVAKLARKRPSPLQASRHATWAAGVVYALGQVNFLSDPASQPCVTAGGGQYVSLQRGDCEDRQHGAGLAGAERRAAVPGSPRPSRYRSARGAPASPATGP